MTSDILFAGQEDFSFDPVGPTYIGGTASYTLYGIPVAGRSSWQYDTTLRRYRSGYSRYALTWYNDPRSYPNQFMRNKIQFNSSDFWSTARLWTFQDYYTDSRSIGNNVFIRYIDSTGNVRLQIRQSGTFGEITLEKVSAANTITTLATSSSGGAFTSNAPAIADKIDVRINYSASGLFEVYRNNNLIVSYSGDITTDSVSSLSYADFGVFPWSVAPGYNVINSWSEIIIATVDTRKMSLVTQSPAGNGNTQNWSNSLVTSSTFFSSIQPLNSSTPIDGSTTYFEPSTFQKSGTISEIGVYTPTPASSTIYVGLYDDNNHSPGNLIGSPVAIVNPSSGITTIPLSSNISVSAGKTYWFGVVSPYNSVTLNYASDSASMFMKQVGTVIMPINGGNSSTTSSGYSFLLPYKLTYRGVSDPVWSETNYDSSPTSGQIQEYTVDNDIPTTGAFKIVSVVQHISASLGSSGPTNLQAIVRTSGTDYFSSNITPTYSWETFQTIFDKNPATATDWTSSDLSINSNINIGYKSV